MEAPFWTIIGIVIGLLAAALLLAATWNRRPDVQRERQLIQAHEQRVQALIQTYEARIQQMDAQIRSEYDARIKQMESEIQTEVERARKQSVDQSRHTIKGQIIERLAPLLPGFGFSPADARFIGHPVDYVVFHGYTDVCDGNGSVDGVEVVILDVKYKTAHLSKGQRAVMDAIRAGRVSFRVVRVDEHGTVTSSSTGYRTHEYPPAALSVGDDSHASRDHEPPPRQMPLDV